MIKFRDIDKVKFIVHDATGLDIMYAYDDMVFPEHGVFLIRFSEEDPAVIFCHFHEDCPDNEKTPIFSSLKISSELNGYKIIEGNQYKLSPKNESEIEIKFQDA